VGWGSRIRERLCARVNMRPTVDMEFVLLTASFNRNGVKKGRECDGWDRERVHLSEIGTSWSASVLLWVLG
jgi:hypothetical protein